MKAKDPAAEVRIEELRKRLEELDAQRTAVSAELHRLVDPESVQALPPAVQKDPIPDSDHQDWHGFAVHARDRIRFSPA